MPDPGSPAKGLSRSTVLHHHRVLSRALRAALRAHRRAQLEERVAAGSLWHDLDLVFAQPTGLPLDYRKDWESWGTARSG